MKRELKLRWMFVLSLFLILSAFLMAGSSEAAKKVRAPVGTQVCIACHLNWLDNDPEVNDVISGAVSVDYVPLNLSSSHTGNPFYTIPEGWTGSAHNIPPDNLTKSDNVPCEACHGSGGVHFGLGPIPIPIPDTKTCGGCHDSARGFDLSAFLKTSHPNPDKNPGKYFDQQRNGTGQAEITRKTPGSNGAPGDLLFKAGTFSLLGDPVSKNERIEECSVCHQYALQYPQFRSKIAEGDLPKKPEVSCGACHDSHIVAPSGIDPAIVNTTVIVTAVSGTGTGTPVAVAPVPGRNVSYINNKPYKLNDNGAQDTINGIWTRGSVINRPQTVLKKGTAVAAVGSDGTCNVITLTNAEGFIQNQVKVEDTILISGVASATVNLPANAKLAGQPVTLQATLDNAAFQVVQVINDTTIIVDRPVAARSNNVTYILANGTSTANLSVTVPFCGLNLNFEIRDMYTNAEDLCGSCHTRGTYKYTKWGKTAGGTNVDLSPTHNTNIGGQFKTSGHANKLAPAWEEFTIFGGHTLNYPYDMSITGSGGVGSLRNKGQTTFVLTSTPDNTLAYLIAKGNTTQPTTTGSFNCLQCHNGLTALDYLNDVQGTPDASVVWGDATLTCITCHDPHEDQTGSGNNIRVPVKLSFNSRFVDAAKNPRGGLNKFLDGTDIPSGVDDGIICLFCHQGRESGLTMYINVTSNGGDPYGQPDAVIRGGSGISFQNPHYLESGAILWSKNSWEYIFSGTPQRYSSGILPHQQTNCVGCHMGEASPSEFEGGHTWRPRVEVCQNCHGSSIQTFQDVPATADWDGNGIVETAFLEIGTVNDLVAGTTDYGLRGQLRQALQAKGIFYNPNANPYFFTSPAFTTNFTAWTTNTLTAAFNLQFMYKAGNCVYVHNPFYAVQILQDSLQAIGAPVKPWVRPAGDRNATDYRTIVVNP